MPGDRFITPDIRRRIPRWAAYAIAAAFEAFLILGLVLISPRFPLGQYPMPYILAIMAVAYFLGEGPAILAFLIGMLAFDYYFIPPTGAFLPIASDAHGWTMFFVFVLGTAAVGLATIYMQRARKRIENLAAASEADLARLQAVMSSLTEGVLISDLDGAILDANPAAIAMHGYQTLQEAQSRFPDIELREIEGPVMPTAERPLARVLHGETLTDLEVTLRRPDTGETRLISYSGASVRNRAGEAILAVTTCRDITEKRLAEQREKELEAHKLNFHRRIILAATDGKLVVTERNEIQAIAGPPLVTWDVGDISGFSAIRRETIALAESLGMEPRRVHMLVTCVGEAVSNANKHAHGGIASIHQVPNGLIFVVTDTGHGIEALRLPDVALVRGYSTAGTLGMGYKMMILSSDRVYLATGPTGTTVAVEMNLRPPSP